MGLIHGGYWLNSDDESGADDSIAEQLGKYYANNTIWLPFWVFSDSAVSRVALGNCGIGVSFGDYTGLDNKGMPTFSSKQFRIKLGSMNANSAGSQICAIWNGTEMENYILGSPPNNVTVTETGGSWQVRFNSSYMSNLVLSGGINAIHHEIKNIEVGTMNPINPMYCNVTLVTASPIDLGNHYFNI